MGNKVQLQRTERNLLRKKRPPKQPEYKKKAAQAARIDMLAGQIRRRDKSKAGRQDQDSMMKFVRPFEAKDRVVAFEKRRVALQNRMDAAKKRFFEIFFCYITVNWWDILGLTHY